MPRLGVLGTMVWDRIHARDGRREPVDEWGGISYALAAAAAARLPGWEIVPIAKVGRDLEEEAFRHLRTLPGLDLETGLRTVAEPNNRVELRYLDRERRCERLTGGVPPWSWPELAPLLGDIDALYVNFISGFEVELETALRLRLGYDGPIYADLHSIFLGVDSTGMRMLRPLASWREWLRCFDAVQMNEDELGMLASAWGDPWRLAAEAVGDELRLILVTLGARGAAYVAAPGLPADPRQWRTPGLLARRQLSAPAASPVRTEHFTGEPVHVEGDAIGCGDVWGATFFSHLLGGAPLAACMRAANRAAARNYAHRGAGGLYEHLQGRIGT